MSQQTKKDVDAETYIRLSQYETAISGDRDYEYDDKIVDVVKRILERDHDVAKRMLSNSCSKIPWKNFSILGLALDMGSIDVFKVLIKLGAEVTFTSEEDNTVLHEAINRTVFIKYLEVQGRVGNPYVDYVLSAQIDSNNSANLKNKYGISHFHIACMTNNVEAVNFFLDNGVDVNAAIKKKSPDLKKYTPLHIAARYCAFETTKVLLDRGANKSLTNADGLRPIHLLIQRNMKIIDNMNMGQQAWYDEFKVDFELNNKMIKLMYYEKSCHSDNIGLNSFHIAAMLDVVMVEEFLSKGVDLHHCVDMNSPIWPGYTALHFAAHFNIDTLRLLLNFGGNILIKDARGMTPFDLCLQRYEAKNIYALIVTQPEWKKIKFLDKETELLELILAMENESNYSDFLSRMPNINTSLPSSSPLWPGYTPLHIAVGFLERNRSIRNLYCETTYQSKDSDSSFCNCSQQEETLYLERIQVCLAQGADVTVQDAYDSTAVHLAFSLQRTCIVGLLLQSQEKLVNPVNQDGLSHLHIACTLKDEIDINKLLTDDSLNTPVMPIFSKCSGNNLSSTKNVIDINSQLDCVQIQGSTPLHIAIASGNHKLINSLIEHDAYLFAKDANGLTPMHAILGMSNSQIAKIQYPECLNNLEETLMRNGLSPLHLATCFNNIEAVEKLLNLGVNVEATVNYNSSSIEGLDSSGSDSSESKYPYAGYRPLHFAVKAGHHEVAKLLLEHGANMLAASDDDAVPFYCSLMMDATAEHNYCTKIFVNALKLDVALQSRLEKRTGLTLLHLACHVCDVDLVKQSLAQGIDVNARARKKAPIYPYSTPLHILIQVEHPNEESVHAIVRLLIDHGADVMLMDDEKKTPIHAAYDRLFLQDYPEIVVKMLEGHRDYNVNPIDAEISHFRVACILNATTQVEGFLRHGVDVDCLINHFNEFCGGKSPLSLAIYHECAETIDLLMKYNANVRVEDCGGQTPLHLAAKHGFSHSVLERIIGAGADVAAENIYAETPFELILESVQISEKSIKLFLKHGCRTNVFNPISDKGFIGIAFATKQNNEKRQQEAFETIMRAADLTKTDEKDRNAIHNIVSVSVGKDNPIDYVNIIERLEKLGCDINHRDQLGKTPLHTAVQFRNFKGILGLLKCGADLNVPDNHEELAFDYNLKPCKSRENRGEAITNLIMMELYKQQYIGLYMNKRNVELFVEARQTLNFDAAMFQTFLNELEVLKKYRSESYSINLYDFLSETGAVASYPHMMPSERQAIDDLFESCRDRLHVDFPEWSRFLLLQYRKARARVPLLQSAKAALYDITNFCLHELCYVAIIRLLSNEDLKCLIYWRGTVEKIHLKRIWILSERIFCLMYFACMFIFQAFFLIYQYSVRDFEF